MNRNYQIRMPARLHERVLREQKRRREQHRSRVVTQLVAEALGEPDLADPPPGGRPKKVIDKV